jgi:purine nucleoside permease
VSNYDREPPGVTAADSLKSLPVGNYSAYLPSLDAAEKVGDKVVTEILTHWQERQMKLPHAP